MVGGYEIFKYEIRKIFKSPIVMVLFLVFLIFDLLMVFNGSKDRENLSVLNNIIDEVGYRINDDMMDKFKIYYDKNLEKAMTIIEKKEGKRYNSISEYVNEVGIYTIEREYTKDQVKIIKDTVTIQNYYTSIPTLVRKYDELNISEIADASIKDAKLSGKAEEIVRQGYEKFNTRATEIKKNREQMQLFFDSSKFKMHEFLYGDVLKAVIIQMMILIGVLVPPVVNHEFDNGTSLVIYSSKRGRKLIKDKLKAIIAAVLILGTGLLTIVLTAFFSIYDYSRVWNASVSSLFNWEYGLPYMSWFNLTVKEHFILMILLSYVCLLIFTAMAFAIGRFVKNSYIGSVLFAILTSLGFFLPYLISNRSSFKIYSTFTPSSLIFNFKTRFMQVEALTCFKYYELITVSIWGVFMITAMWYSIKTFKKQCIS